MKKSKHHKNKRPIPSRKEDVSGSFGKKLFFGSLVIILFLSSMYGYRCFVGKDCEVELLSKLVRGRATVLMPQGALEAEVAKTKSSRELGLSFRESMRDDEGMLFIFEKSGRYGFWMKDMKFSIDIIWINEKGIVVNVERNVTPNTYPSTTFINSSDAKYVLEINEGLAKKFGLFIGSKVKIVE